MRRPMLHTCTRSGCCTWTLGEFCLEHEQPVRKTFARGRPYPLRPRSRVARELLREAA